MGILMPIMPRWLSNFDVFFLLLLNVLNILLFNKMENVFQLQVAATSSRRSSCVFKNPAHACQLSFVILPLFSTSSVAEITDRSAAPRQIALSGSRTPKISSSVRPTLRAMGQCCVHSYIAPVRQPMRIMINSRNRSSSLFPR